MLVDRSEPEDVFARVPEVAAQTDPVLKALDRLLEDDQLYHQVRADLGKRHRFTKVAWAALHAGGSDLAHAQRPRISLNGATAKPKSASAIAWCCAGSVACTLRRCPTKPRGSRWLHTVRPETLHALNDRVVQLAAQAKVTKGRKLRLDATCVQTNIHHPTDSGRLLESVRVLSRFVPRAKALVKEQVHNVQQTCRSRLRSARQAAQRLHRQLRRKGEDKEAQQKELYQKLRGTAEQRVRQSRASGGGPK